MRQVWVILLCLFILAGCSSSLGELPEPDVPVASRILDSSGKLITQIGEFNRYPVDLDEISNDMQNALVAIEDYRFYQHYGVDPIGLVRAAYNNLRAGKIVEGGSTITQQLAKNLYLTHERTFTRKVKELYYAIQLERAYTKDEILNQYLNTVYFGQGTYGVQTAANAYFNKDAKDLTLAESAMLAGFLKGPSYYSLPENYSAAKERQEIVLNRMFALEYITKAELDAAVKENISIKAADNTGRRAAYFVAELIEQLDQLVPGGKERLYTEGLIIETTLDLKMQQAAEQAMQQVLAQEPENLQGALVAINPQNGYIMAMVGGRDYGKSQLNRAVDSARQPGSAFKPFVYAAALEQGLTAATTFSCDPIKIPQANGEDYVPTDHGANYHYRPMTLKEALKISDNVVSVKLNVQVGPENVVELAQRLGIKTKLEPVDSLALGTSLVTPLDIASAYGVFANGGIYAEPIYFTRVLDRDGNVLYSQRSKLVKVMDEKDAYIVTNMLESALEPGGTGANLRTIIGQRPAAGKTGTTDDLHDAWFVGYTPQVTAAVYVGYDEDKDDQKKNVGKYGGEIAGPIWAQFIKESLAEQSPTDFVIPKGIIFKPVCLWDGLLSSPASTGVIDVPFVAGTEPIAVCSGDHWSR
ncbi:PBP1A family penicillin-binding protein [Peptococcaceae bacterium 1198_IL3148]